MASTPRKAAAARKRADIPDPFDAQQELTPAAPAPAAADANDAARSAIATINTQLTEFDKVQAGLADLERKYKGVAYAVDTPKGMDEACAARLEIRRPRFAVENARKAAKAPVLALGRDIDARAASITQRLVAIEDPIDAQIKAQERKEAERKAAHEQRLAEIMATPSQCIGKTAAQLREVLEALDSMPLADFEEYRERAAAAQHQAVLSLQQLLTNAEAAEELARVRAQRQAEEDRKAALQLRLNSIGDVLARPFRTSERVQQAIDRLRALEIGDDWQEYAPAARERKAQVLGKLTERMAEVMRVEQEALAREQQREPLPVPPALDAMPSTVAPGNGLPPAGGPNAMVPDPAPGWPAGWELPAQRFPTQEEWAEQFLNQPQTSEQFQKFLASDGSDNPHTVRVEGLDLRHDLPPVDLTGTWVETSAPAPAPAEAFPLPGPGPAANELEFVVDRPSDAEILNLVASHYDVTRERAATWLREMDVTAALAQMPLQEA